MRKATVELIPCHHYKNLFRDVFEKIEYLELVQMLRIDFDRGHQDDKWLSIAVDSDEILEDIKKLLIIRRKPERT